VVKLYFTTFEFKWTLNGFVLVSDNEYLVGRGGVSVLVIRSRIQSLLFDS
jgi:hypothetical protein